MIERELFYNEARSQADTITAIRACLDATDEAKLKDPAMAWENHIQWACWKYGVSPVPVLVALVRERSLMTDNASPASVQDFRRAAGVVGQHTAGTANPTYDGFPKQIELCARTYAWLIGAGPRSNFGYRPGLWPTKERWSGAATHVDLLDLKGAVVRKQPCISAQEYADWAYTPNALKNMPAENQGFFEQHVQPHF